MLFFILFAIALFALVGVMIYITYKKPTDDDEKHTVPQQYQATYQTNNQSPQARAIPNTYTYTTSGPRYGASTGTMDNLQSLTIANSVNMMKGTYGSFTQADCSTA